MNVSQDVKIQNCKGTSLFKGICVLTCMINKLFEQITVRSELFREAIDAFALLDNADTGFNQRHGES